MYDHGSLSWVIQRTHFSAEGQKRKRVIGHRFVRPRRKVKLLELAGLVLMKNKKFDHMFNTITSAFWDIVRTLMDFTKSQYIFFLKQQSTTCCQRAGSSFGKTILSIKINYLTFLIDFIVYRYIFLQNNDQL